MPRDYFRCLYRHKGVERFLIWFSDDRDGVFADAFHRVPTFASAEALESAFPALVDAEIVPHAPILHDLDAVESRCRADGSLVIDSADFLAAWNLFIDVARSVGDAGASYLASDSVLGHEYEKMFFGNNLPAMTPPGEHYTPTWTDDELDDIRRHVILGFDLFEATTYAHVPGTNQGESGRGDEIAHVIPPTPPGMRLRTERFH